MQEKIRLEEVLDRYPRFYRRQKDKDGYSYLFAAEQKYGHDRSSFAVVDHGYPAESCADKAYLLSFGGGQWPVERVIRTAYVGDRETTTHGIVAPDYGTIDLRAFAEYARAESMTPRVRLPVGMRAGICTPLVTGEHFRRGLRRVYFHDLPELDDKLIDVPIPGCWIHSLHIKYGLLQELLRAEFGGQIVKGKVPFIESAKIIKEPVLEGTSYGC
jgi:hypothetical protein